MKKTIFVMAVLCFGMVGLTQAMTVDLVAGQDMVVGTVEVTKNLDGDLLVKYTVDAECEDVLLTETHLHIGEDLGDFPLTGGKNKNPKIGKFDYSMDHDPAVSEYTYQIPAEDLPDEPFKIAAHAVTGTDFCSVDELPEVVTGQVCWPTGDPSKYFEFTISGEVDPLDAWCADPALDIGLTEYPCTPSDVDWAVDTDVPSEINCLLNLIYRGETAAFNTGDLQLALWILIEGLEDLEALDALYPQKKLNMIAWGLSDESTVEDNVAAILELVAEQCDGFEPGCCDVMGVLLIPVDPLQVVEDPPGVFTEILRQPILIAIPAPCCETAWGDGETGSRFSTSSWATYFEFPED